MQPPSKLRMFVRPLLLLAICSLIALFVIHRTTVETRAPLETPQAQAPQGFIDVLALDAPSTACLPNRVEAALPTPQVVEELIELTNLDSRFETPLLLRVERDGEITEEYETNPSGQRAQKFPVQSGSLSITVIPIPKANGFPVPGTLPVKKDTLVLAPGETHTYALYPR